MSRKYSLLGGALLSAALALGFLSGEATLVPQKALALVGVCNGVTDDTAAINAALAAGTGIVELNKGNCRVAGQIVFPNLSAGHSFTGLKGQGISATTILPDNPFTGGAAVIRMNGSGELRDLRIEGSSQNLFGVNDASSATDQSSNIWRVWFDALGTSNGGAYQHSGTGNYAFHDNYVVNSWYGIYNSDGGSNSDIGDNFIWIQGGGLYLGSVTTPPDGVNFHDNQLQQTGPNTSYGVKIDAGANTLIRGNVISPIIDRVSGILGNSNTTITNTKIIGNWVEGVVIQNGYQGEIGSNFIPNGDVVNLFPITGSPMRDWDVHDNIFDGADNHTGSIYSLALSNMTGVIVHHNMAKNQGNAVGGFYNAGSNPTFGNHILVEGNLWDNPCNKGGATFVWNTGGGATCANNATYPTNW